MSSPRITLAALRAEYREVLIGEVIYERVKSRVRSAMKRRPLAVYSQGESDQSSATESVTNSFALDVLIGERQMDFVMLMSKDMNDFDRLIGMQLKRYLARTRQRSVVDNIVERSLKILSETPFRKASGAGEENTFELEAPDPIAIPSGRDPLRFAVFLAQSIPRDKGIGGSREPRIWSHTALRAVLALLARCIDRPMTRKDLYEFFTALLTPWLPSFLELSEGLSAPSQEPGPSDSAIVRGAVEEIVSSLSKEEMVMLRYKLAHLSDSEAAASIGVSRPTLVSRRSDLFSRIALVLTGMEPDAQLKVVESLSISVSEPGRQNI